MKEKKTKVIPVGTTQTRYIVTLIGDPVSGGENDKRLRQYALLTEIVNNPQLMNCGSALFEKAKMYFAGDSWVFEMEAVVDGVPGAGFGNAKIGPASGA